MEITPHTLPAWASELASIYRGGTATVFVVHGNVFDLVPARRGESVEFVTLKDYLADQLFPQRSAVIFYDPSSGITFRSEKARDDFHRVAKAAAAVAGKTSYDYSIPRDAYGAVRAIEQYLRSRVSGETGGAAVIADYAQTICPPGEFSTMSAQEMSTLVTLLKWANDPTLMRADITICLITENLADLHPSLVGNPFVQKVRIELPRVGERAEFIRNAFDRGSLTVAGELNEEALSERTSGLSRVNIHQLISQARRNNEKITALYLSEKKKALIERGCMGLLEFIEPKFGLKMVAGHDGAKRWLSDDARLLKEGHIAALPMGYLICGPVGTGKSFLVTSVAGEIGIPLVRLKNFRSMWVGATEGNLEKIISTLRSLGPVGVVVDEADAALGSRREKGDSGVSSRVFGMIAEQMGNTDYRGRILWFLLTARPDLVPIDLKRQGRAEVHIPLFYPETPEEVANMVVVMAKKNGAPITNPDKINVPAGKKLSGSDIEGIVVRANRRRLLEGKEAIEAEELNEEVAKFPERADDAEIRMQTLAAVYECTHDEFLPERYRRMDRARLLADMQNLKHELGEY